MTSAAATTAAPAESLSHLLAEVSAGDYESCPFDPPRRFAGHSRRLHLLLGPLLRPDPPPGLHSPSLLTSLGGIAAYLSRAAAALAKYREKSRIYVLIHCKPLCSTLLECSHSIASWLALIADSPHQLPPEFLKKASDLSRDMQHVNLQVTENEERVYFTLQREAEVRHSSKAVQSAIIMDLSRALGIDSSDKRKLGEQIELLKRDLAGSSTVAERRILLSLEKTFESWTTEPYAGGTFSSSGFEEDAHIPAFKNFLCPLTKEVMREPVTLESGQTYERSAIRYWIDRCLEDGRDPTCPVTGQVLRSLVLKPNLGLMGAIEEWIMRNVDVQVGLVVKCLRDEGEVDRIGSIERGLEGVFWMLEEQPSSRYKVRNAGIVSLVIEMLKGKSNVVGSLVRSKALMVLHSMIKDEESKLIMLEGGITRLSIRSLTGSTEKEREHALRILLEFSGDEGYCANLASEKGALVLLSSLSGSTEYPTLSNLAEEILKKMDQVEENVQHLAAVGRFQPLLIQLLEGTPDVKIKTASLIGTMPLANNGKEYIARHGGKILIDMLSSSQGGTMPSLLALYNLSALDDGATILVDLGVLPAITNILFKMQHGDSTDMELAASTLANIVSKSGHWELLSSDKNECSLQSEITIHKLLDLLSLESSKFQVAVLQILYGIVLSPQASDLAAVHIRSGRGISKIIQFLGHSDEPSVFALRLASLLSSRVGQDLAEELRASNKIPLLIQKLLNNQCSIGEKCEVARILSNIPLLDEEIKNLLGVDLLKWIVSNLKEQPSSSSARHTRRTPTMVEGLIGILLHFVKSHDPEIQSVVRDHHLLSVFLEQLMVRSHSKEKQRAALGLKHLSKSSWDPSVTQNLEAQPPRGFCVPLSLVCGKTTIVGALCPLHSVMCEEDTSFCLLRGNAIQPLIDLMSDGNTGVQIAAVKALCTIFSDMQGLKNAANELEQLGLFRAAVDLLKEVRPGELQERVIWMVERFLREERIAQEYATDQFLVRALVEAMKHGSANTKKSAQDALTNLRQLSGVGGRNSAPICARRNAH